MAKNESNYTPVSISRSNKLRLQSIKGRLSFDEYLGKILDFVEISGVNVNTPAVPAHVAIKDQANRIIEVMRGIEKTQNKMILNVQHILSGVNVEVENPEFMERTEDVAMLFEEHKKLVGIHASQTEELQRLRMENENLNKKLNEIPKSTNDLDIKRIKEIISEIENRKNTNTFNPANYEISKQEFDAYLEMLKKEIKK